MLQSKIQLKSKIEKDLSKLDFAPIGRRADRISQPPVLVLSPHPDDDVIGMGGTMGLLADQGKNVFSVYVTSGSADPGLAGIRRAEALAALKIVGGAGAFFLHYDSGQLKTRTRSLASQLRKIITGLNPAEIYLPGPFERHPTHRLVTRGALQATGTMKSSIPLWGYSVWGGIYGLRGMKVVDISKYLKIKQRAIRRHASQIALKPYDRGMLGRNAYEGIYLQTHGERYMDGAELFCDMALLKPAAALIDALF